MPTAARLALAAWRHEDRTFTLVVQGVDLTNLSMLMQIRLAPDTPGAPLLSLTETAGLHFASVATVNAIPVSTITGTITKAQMEALPYSGELGDDTSFAFNLQLGGVTRAYGTFTALATVNGADNAPANRPASSGGAGGAGGLWSTAQITIGPDTVTIAVDGVQIIQRIAADLATQAQVTTAIGAALAGAVAAVPVNSNPNELSAAVPPPAVNSSFDVLIVVTNTGDTYLTAGGVRLHVTNGGGVAMPAGSLATGTIVTLMYSPGGVFAVTAARSVNQSPAILASLATVTGVTEQLVGAPLAYPVGGNVNEIIAPDAAAPALNATFEVLLTATNTGETYLTAGGVRLRISDGGGTSIAAGGLVNGMIVSLNRSPGGAFVLNSSRPIVTPKIVEAVDDPALSIQPWGPVSFASGARVVTTTNVYVTTPGSSNAASGVVAAGSVPADMIVAALTDAWPSTRIAFLADNQAVAGAPMVAIAGQLAASAHFQNGDTRWVFPFFWMNDARTVYYHSQGGIMAELAGLRAGIAAIRAKGAEPVLVTGFHPDPRAPTVALDPNFFADPTDQGNGVRGTTSNMDYPAAKAAPVNPENDMWPPASDPMKFRDWSGSGILRTGYKRVWHVNRLIRRLAAETKCVLIDIEKASFRLAIETVPDLSAGLETFYDSTPLPNGPGPLHPKAAMFQTAIKPAIIQWAQAQASGDFGRRIFTGY